MRCPETSPDEAGRLRALAQYRIDPDHGLPALAPIVDMAAKLLDCPGAAVNMVGDDRVFFAAQTGIDTSLLRREISFCAHTINQQEILVVEDATLDARFHDNPLVTTGAIRFYAGIALRAPSGHALGALCVVDSQPHARLSGTDRARLHELARLVSDKLELRRLAVAADVHPRTFAATADGSTAAILCCDETGAISSCNEVAAAMFGWRADELAGQDIESLVVPADRRVAHRTIRRVLRGNLPIDRETRIGVQRRDGSTFVAEVHLAHWHEGDALRFGIILHDLSQVPRERETLLFLEEHDPLTQLPNRRLLLERLRQALVGNDAASLIITGLHGHGDINNTLGHEAGDHVLREVADRILGAVPADALVARLSDDQFATMLPGRDPLAASALARAIAQAIARPFMLEQGEVRLGSYSGIALAPDHAGCADELVGNAELALVEATGSGPGASAFFVPQLRAKAVARRLFETAAHRACENGEFTLHYQPQIRLATGAVTGAEALIRWDHPDRGLLLPRAFLAALEASPLSERVGTWVLDAACAQAAAWRRTQPDFEISVNLSASQFRSGTLPATVAETLARHALPAAALELEITENIALDQHAGVLPQLDAIRALGVRLSFDDFGTGYASLTLLRSFPVTHIKIDKSFVQLMQTSAKDLAIVRNLVRLAADLGLEVIAEGVEQAGDAALLAQLGCGKGQGYHFGKPCSAALFAEHHLGVDAAPQIRKSC